MSEVATPEDLSTGHRQRLASWLLAMSDNKQLLGLRYAEWCTGAPELEADIAASAMAQFELGHARVLHGVLGDLPEDPRDETRDTDVGAWYSLPALDTPFSDWYELVVANTLIDTLLSVNLRSALEGGYKPLTQRLRKVLAEEEYHAVHAAAWTRRLAAGPEPAAARLGAVIDGVWPQCLAWFGPETGNGLDELHEAALLADSAAGLRERYLEPSRRCSPTQGSTWTPGLRSTGPAGAATAGATASRSSTNAASP